MFCQIAEGFGKPILFEWKCSFRTSWHIKFLKIENEEKIQLTNFFLFWIFVFFLNLSLSQKSFPTSRVNNTLGNFPLLERTAARHNSHALKGQRLHKHNKCECFLPKKEKKKCNYLYTDFIATYILKLIKLFFSDFFWIFSSFFGLLVFLGAAALWKRVCSVKRDPRRFCRIYYLQCFGEPLVLKFLRNFASNSF